jgi:hypothetical protein
MIGGQDIILKTRLDPQVAREVLVRISRHIWPNQVEEPIVDIPHAVFVYRDQKSKDSWDKDGVTEENDEQMMQFICRHEQVTIVWGDKHPANVARFMSMVLSFKYPAVPGCAFCFEEKELGEHIELSTPRTTQYNELITACDEIKILEENHAQHIKGWKCGFFPDEDILKYTHGEVAELEAAPDDINEMADSLVCLFSYCVRKKWSPDQIGKAIRFKLREKFKNLDKLIEEQKNV